MASPNRYPRIDPGKLTPEQRVLWDELDMSTTPVPSGDQTSQQVRNLVEDQFRYACALDGMPLDERTATS